MNEGFSFLFPVNLKTFIFSTSKFVLNLNLVKTIAFVSYGHVVLGLDVVSNPVCVHYHKSHVSLK